MIDSFRHKGLEKLFLTGSKKGIQPEHSRKLEDILDRLDAAIVVGDENGKVQDVDYKDYH